MNFDRILILSTGTGIILFVYWYFFGKKEDTGSTVESLISINVDAGYSPSHITVKKNVPVTLKILRTDPSDCLDQLVLPEWNIIRTLPLNKETTVTFTPTETGEFRFRCGMNMFHGTIIVK